jgi:hypothetical protein
VLSAYILSAGVSGSAATALLRQPRQAEDFTSSGSARRIEDARLGRTQRRLDL